MAQHRKNANRSEGGRSQQDVTRRINSLEPVQSGMGLVLHDMPEHLRLNLLKERRVRQIHDQFRQMAPKALLDQVNSIFLFREEEESMSQADQGQSKRPSQERPYRLVVYVENSIAKAEFNARREMIRLKYLELFGVEIQRFDIKTSKAGYRDTHPFRLNQGHDDANAPSSRESYMEALESQLDRKAWTLDGTGAFQQTIASMDDGPLKESFQRLQSSMNKKSSKKR